MKRLGEIADTLDSGKALGGDEFYDLIEDVSVTAYRCPVCGRLHLENDKNKFNSCTMEPTI